MNLSMRSKAGKRKKSKKDKDADKEDAEEDAQGSQSRLRRRVALTDFSTGVSYRRLVSCFFLVCIRV